ncbi:MAG: aminoacyl-tRNA hydrolase [Patescibacteria group bacterium]
MILIVGLGNPGKEYRDTRHNLGTVAIEPFSADYENKFDSLISKFNGQDALIALPQTYMNESGRAVAAIKNFYKITEENIWVAHDDVDLPLGTIRVSHNASAAGHRGVQSIIDHMGTQNFWRIRLGIGRPAGNIPTDAYVLQKFTQEELEKIPSFVKKTDDAIARFLSNGISEETIQI